MEGKLFFLARTEKENRLQQEEKSESDRQKTLQRELEWISMSPRAAPRKIQGPHKVL